MDYVRFHACLHPHRLAVMDLASNRHWTYARFDDLVARLGTLLVARGIGEGARVACLAKNSAEIIALHLACARVGAIFVPLNWRLSANELQHLIDDCEPAVLFGDEMAAELGLPVEAVDLLEGLSKGLVPMACAQMPDDLPSLMLYTSGTTGKPKGVLLSERNLTETAINFTLLGEVDCDSRFLCESPMFHIIGMVTSVRPAFLNGGCVVVSDRFDPVRTLARLADPGLKISHYFCVPQMAAALRSVDVFDPDKLRGLKAIFTGGAPHPEAQIRGWLADDLAIVDGYGMSEAGTVFGMPLDRALIDAKAGCVGIPTPRVQARIMDDLNQPAPHGVAGELQLKGANITCGYWRREADFKDSLTEDGWFRTGDILTQDSDGFFRVTDRKKDMFISGGENVYPGEVEAHLVNYAGIREMVVVGVPDEKWGEVGCLFYVPEADEIGLEHIEAYLADKLARYKIPKKSVVLETLPRNGVGKVLKHELRRMAGG